MAEHLWMGKNQGDTILHPHIPCCTIYSAINVKKYVYNVELEVKIILLTGGRRKPLLRQKNFLLDKRWLLSLLHGPIKFYSPILLDDHCCSFV